jgi:methionine synthase / methylenetetrahydrofolate reductase(NADPH)
MGTLLYSYGVDFCFEQLNISQSERILDVHLAYLDAGADVIQTNTYAANLPKLRRYGLDDDIKEINKQAVRIAKQAVNLHADKEKAQRAFILGTIGGTRGIRKTSVSLDEMKKSTYLQLEGLLSETIDGILLETFYDFEELETILALVKKETDLPVIAQVSTHEVGFLQNGVPLANALHQLEEVGADVVGINCRLGPHHMIRSLEKVEIPHHAFLSVYPNASHPNYSDGRLNYATDADYFAKSAMDLRLQGARLIGGCCGTTPEHIEQVASVVKGLPPVLEKTSITQDRLGSNNPLVIEKINPRLEKQQSPDLHELCKVKKAIIVELDPPKHLDLSTFMEGAKALKDAGIDALTLADNSLATPRISNMAIGTILKEQLDLTPLVHIACRDRNLIGLQSHLLGLHTLGINQVLAVTGDPTKVGDFPGATSVYDVSSFELMQYIKKSNEGISFSGRPLKEKTAFSVAAAFNPNVRHLERAVKRLEKKIEYGADYFISQPVFNKQQLVDIYQETKHLNVPIFIGIMPLTSSRNAEFLHHEVPGIKLTDEIRERMLFSKQESAELEGLTIAKELIDVAYDLFKGIYLITPFLKYNLSVALVNYLRDKERKASERKIILGKNTTSSTNTKENSHI